MKPCAPKICHCPTPRRCITALRSSAHNLGSVSTDVIRIGAYFKMHFAKIKETDLSKRLGQIFIIRPRNNDAFRVDRFVRREYLTDIYIRLVNRIFSRYPSLPKNSFFKQNAVLALANFRNLYHSFQRKSIKYRNSYHCSSF